MLTRLVFALSLLALAGPALAAQPVTINNAGNTDSVTVTGHHLDVNATLTGGGTVNAVITGGITATTTPAAFTIATGNTFQSILASNASRKGCLIQNPIAATETLFVFFGANGSATTGASIGLSPGSAVSCAVGGLATATDNISATAATTSHAGVVYSQ